jgi:hypothetical protein
MNTDNTQGGAEPSPASAGSQPVAWATVSTEGATAGTLWTFSDSIEAAFRKKVDSYQPCDIVPLYRKPQPTLTDEEREAVEWFSNFARPQNGPVIGRHAAALRGLLERTGGTNG